MGQADALWLCRIHTQYTDCPDIRIRSGLSQQQYSVPRNTVLIIPVLRLCPTRIFCTVSKSTSDTIAAWESSM